MNFQIVKILLEILNKVDEESDGTYPKNSYHDIGFSRATKDRTIGHLLVRYDLPSYINLGLPGLGKSSSGHQNFQRNQPQDEFSCQINLLELISKFLPLSCYEYDRTNDNDV